MLTLSNEPAYSTPVATMVSVINRMNPRLSTHYLEFLLGHMANEHFFWLGNLTLLKVNELVNAENPPAWVPASFAFEVDNLRNKYRSIYR